MYIDLCGKQKIIYKLTVYLDVHIFCIVSIFSWLPIVFFDNLSGCRY